MVKPSNTSSNQRFGEYAAALDEELAAVGSWTGPDLQKVFVYNISVNPAKELAVLTNPDRSPSGDDRFGVIAVAVSREYGILVGAHDHDIGSAFISGLSC